MDRPIGRFARRRCHGPGIRRTLCALLSSPRPVHETEIADHVWHDDVTGGSMKSVWTWVHRLRNALAGSGYRIVNLHGRGYLLTRDVEENR